MTALPSVEYQVIKGSDKQIMSWSAIYHLIIFDGRNIANYNIFQLIIFICYSYRQQYCASVIYSKHINVTVHKYLMQMLLL